MLNLQTNLIPFNGTQFLVNHSISPSIGQISRKIYSLNDIQLKCVFKIFLDYLIASEQKPIKMKVNDVKSQFQILGTICIGLIFKKNIECRGVITQEEMCAFDRHFLGYCYRHKYFHNEDSLIDLEKLKNMAFLWKKSQLPFRGKECINLNELKKLEDTLKYSSFLNLLSKSLSLQSDYFKWIILDENNPDMFVEYPYTQKKINDSLLSSRIGFFRESPLNIEEKLFDSEYEKDVTLLFEGKKISILDGSKKVVFNSGQVFTVNQIFENFKLKRVEWGDFEFFENGIRPWHCGQIGFYSPYHEKYVRESLNKIEPIAIFDKDQVIERYGLDDIPADNNWLVCVMSNRQFDNLGPLKTHAWIEWVKPLGDDRYGIHAAGKFPVKFPVGTVEFFLCMFSVEHAVIAYPDMNVFSKHRQFKSMPFFITGSEGERLEEILINDIKEGHGGNLAYQFLIHNCAWWTWKTVSKVVGQDRFPNPFKCDFYKCELNGPMGVIFNQIKKLPPGVRDKVMTVVFYIFGAWKEKRICKKDGTHKIVSIGRTPPWDGRTMVIHPGLLFQ